jgi:D-galactose 1-dehydrogenase
MTQHNIGIIGFGKIARDQHSPAIAASPDFKLVAVSNGAAIAEGQVRCFDDYPQMLSEATELDAVAICTPPGPRRTIAAACLAAGKHVLLEKPPAGTVAEVADIAARAAAANKVAFSTYHAQHNAAVKRAAEVLAGQTVKRLQVTWKEDLRRWHPGEGWILAAGGFGIFDPGINALSILTRVLPEAIFIHAAELLFPANRQAPIAANLTFSTGHQDDEVLTAALDWRQAGDQTWEIAIETGAGSKVQLSDGGARLEVDGQPPFEGAADEYPDIYREFATLLATNVSKVEPAPFQLVADAFMLASRREVESFEF